MIGGRAGCSASGVATGVPSSRARCRAVDPDCDPASQQDAPASTTRRWPSTNTATETCQFQSHAGTNQAPLPPPTPLKPACRSLLWNGQTVLTLQLAQRILNLTCVAVTATLVRLRVPSSAPRTTGQRRDVMPGLVQRALTHSLSLGSDVHQLNFKEGGTIPMSRTFHHGKNRERHIRVHGIRRDPIDLRRLARALIDLAQAEAEAAAQAEHQAEPNEVGQPTPTPTSPPPAPKSTPTPRKRRAA